MRDWTELQRLSWLEREEPTYELTLREALVVGFCGRFLGPYGEGFAWGVLWARRERVYDAAERFAREGTFGSYLTLKMAITELREGRLSRAVSEKLREVRP